MTFHMNPQRGQHMGGEEHGGSSGEHGGGNEHEHGGKLPDIHIKSHSAGHTVHIMHQDGRHESHEHAHGDTEGMAEHVHNYLGGEQRPENEGEAGSESERVI